MSLSSEILADSPARYFKHDEPSGTTCVDSSTNGLNGTYTGGFTLAQSGIPSGSTAVLLDGTTGYVDFTANGVDTSSGDWTYETWVFPNSYSGGNRGLIGAQAVGGYSLYVNAVPALAVTLVDVSDATAATVVPPVGSWSHVAAKFVDATNAITYYLNGLPNGTATYATAPTAGKKASAIGARSHDVGTNGFFSGLFQHSAIYQAALSDARMLAHYNAGILPVSTDINLPTWPRVRFTG